MESVFFLLQCMLVAVLAGMVLGVFPLLIHCALYRLCGWNYRWTRWIMPGLVLLHMGRSLLISGSLFQLGLPISLGILLTCEGLLLFSTRYMEQDSK